MVIIMAEKILMNEATDIHETFFMVRGRQKMMDKIIPHTP